MTQPRHHGRNAVAGFLLLAAGTFAAVPPVAAIELGAARLNSVANAPLEIDIALLDVAPGELESLQPQLPANSRSPELASASIELVQAEGRPPVLRVRTAQPVAAGDLRFVVVADWGRGRKFREYTISLGGTTPSLGGTAPPAVSAAAPASSSADSPPPPAETTFSTSRAGDAPPSDVVTSTTGTTTAAMGTAASPQAMAPAAGLKTTRIVRNGETLMSISREWSARTGATLAQTMLGIFRENPQAFGPRGMNELLVGSEIVLPESATLASTTAAAASGEIGRALGIWRTSGGASTAATPPLGSAPSAQQATPATPPKPTSAAPASASASAPAAKAPASSPAAGAPLSLAPAGTPAVPQAAAPAVPETPEALIARLQLELVDKTADLAAATTQIAALKAQLAAAAQAAAAVKARTAEEAPGGWLIQAQRLAALTWWAAPLLLLTTLGLLLALILQRGRRALAAESASEAEDTRVAESTDSAESTELSREPAAATEFSAVYSPAAAKPAVLAPAVAAPAEMSFDLPPIKASRANEGLPDVLLGETPVVRPVRAVVDDVLTEDLEGDPPPVDEAGSKINLARAFIEMGHHDAAILELQAALRLGDETQRAEALRLLDSLPKS